jgi:hypothetical protein
MAGHIEKIRDSRLFAQETPGVTAEIEDGGRDGGLTAFCCPGRYDMEYAKEDGASRFLKLACRITYMTPYDKGWVRDGTKMLL